MASINKLSNGRWQARYRDPAGRQHSKNFDRKRDAELWAGAQEQSKANGQWIDPGGARTLFKDWAAQWAEGESVNRRSSRARDASYLRTHLLPEFGPMPLGAIGYLEVRSWVGRLSAKGKAPATVVCAYQLLAKIMRTAVSSGLIQTSPCQDIDLPKIEREEMRFLMPAEVATLADKIDPRYRALVLVGAYGGFRIGEMAGLKRARVNPMTRRIDVVEICTEVQGHQVWGAPKTKAGRRSVTLPAQVMAELEQHLARYSSEELVFPAPEGGVLRVNSWRRRFWAPAVKAAGLEPLRPHDLRHTAVALWIATGANMLEVSKRAGHASTTFTLDRYGHLFPDADEAVADRLAALFVSQPPAASASVAVIGHR